MICGFGWKIEFKEHKTAMPHFHDIYYTLYLDPAMISLKGMADDCTIICYNDTSKILQENKNLII